ncbi:hypothetical protein L249_2450 [Ophiocordyceps polyrhachis-furcata BCC 54312]|uniref:Uncharacterized protein n=1 Tax=Ophiocordyceps polyrhachis-furcata BCC 54312 TaxID=1330021 RepID=A0A367LPK0_9HYPO|nr:hypothetical protein L249_2450 [Ophiocordyceps polyrhachis-furcata BCC 54312]
MASLTSSRSLLRRLRLGRFPRPRTPRRHRPPGIAPPSQNLLGSDHGEQEHADVDHLADLLSAVQRQDPRQTSQSFIAWTSLISDRSSPRHALAVQQARELPATTLSEMIRNLDPVANPRLDVAHGLNISSGMTQFTSACNLVDEFGVRRHHRQVLAGMTALLKVRAVSPSDCEVMMRCAGAGLNIRQVKRFWSAPVRLGLKKYRSPKTWIEFIKGRFMTEPLYYQFDRARIAVLPRDLQRSGSRRMPNAIVRYLDGLRMGRSVLQFEPWNRQHWRPDQDWRRYLRHTGRDFRSYGAHFRRAICYPTTIDEEFLCVSMVAFARSNGQRAIREEILTYHYGITFFNTKKPPGLRPAGGRELRPDHPIRPTARLLDAIVESFGAMSETLLGLELVQFVSQRWKVPIPARTWSNLLNWTYVCATKPLRQMRRFFDRGEMGAASMRDISHVWSLMHSHKIEPSFDDWCCWARALITVRAFASAVPAITDHMVPHFDALDAEYRAAVLEELLTNENAVDRPPSHRRLEAQARKDHARTAISHCLHQLLKVASRTPRHRAGPVMQCLVPDLIRDLPDFFPPDIVYRSSQGLIQLGQPDAPRRFRWIKAWRTALPARYSALDIPEDSRNWADDLWPEIQDMRILGWHRLPTERAGSLDRAPPRRRASDVAGAGESSAWIRGLRRELML